MNARKNRENTKRKCINGINNDDMMAEITRELTTATITSEITSEQVLAWIRRMEAQRAHNVLTEATKVT